MFIDLTKDQRALQAEIRTYFAHLISPEETEAMRTDRHGPAYRQVVRRMGEDGWLGVGWPVEYGGRGFGEMEQQIFVNEAARADIPLPYVTLQTVGPTLQRYGTEEQKQKFLAAILAGEVHFAIGYSEPEAGTDLAALKTTAVRDGDSYVINGQKIFDEHGDPAVPRVRGARAAGQPDVVGVVAAGGVDTADPGFSWTPIITCDGAHHVNATYYSDVRVPASMLVGEENAGWKLITTQLNHERVMLGPAGRMAGLYSRVQQWAAQPGPDGTAPISKSDVQRALGEIHAYWRLNELLNWQVSSSTADAVAIADASATKVFATERIQRIGRLVEEVVGRHGDPADPATAELMSWLDLQIKRNLVITFGGGVNEVMRELIATAGLKLPRVPR